MATSSTVWKYSITGSWYTMHHAARTDLLVHTVVSDFLGSVGMPAGSYTLPFYYVSYRYEYVVLHAYTEYYARTEAK